MIPRTNYVFDRQRIVVAGEESVAIALVIETLRRDGHCVTHAADSRSAASDLALRHCHLVIVSSGFVDVLRSDLIGELRGRSPAMALLCLTRAERGSTAGTSARFHTLQEPFTVEELRAAVRPLLPALRLGSVLARSGLPKEPGGICDEPLQRTAAKVSRRVAPAG